MHYVQQPHYATGLMFLMVIGSKHNQSFGGLDLRSLAEHSCAVFISSMTSSGQCSPDDRHMMQAVTCFKSQVPLHESITVEAVLASPPPQKYLSKRLHSEAFQHLEPHMYTVHTCTHTHTHIHTTHLEPYNL